MRLRITTPLEIVVDEDDVRSVRAEDASGGFGIQPGHTEFLTVLAISVLGWKDADGMQHYCALRRGVLTADGAEVAVATREAVAGDDLVTLEQTVLARFRAAVEAERSARVETTRMQLEAIRRMASRLQPASGNPGLSS